jgi:hypothetical protein
VFKFLLEVLQAEEFELLSFYNVNRFIDTCFQTKLQVTWPGGKLTMREFVYCALDLEYTQSEKSARFWQQQ